MSVKEFIPTIWSEKILREADRNHVFVADCTREYEGDIKGMGDSVKILSVGDPTMKNYTRGAIDAPEHLDTSAIKLVVDQAKYFNFGIEDVDKAQSAVKGLMDEATKRAGRKIANVHDEFIANMVTDSNVKKVYSSVNEVVVSGASAGQVNVLEAIDLSIRKMRENDITSETIIITVSPRFADLLRRAYIARDTDNSEMMKAAGYVMKYHGAIIKESNNVKRTTTTATGDTDNIMVRTGGAIAFVNQLTETEAYRPDLAFEDAIKILDVYGGKIIRPKEILNLAVKFTGNNL